MIYEPTQLEGASYGTQGWNNIYSSNFEKLNDYLAKFEDLWNSTPDDWNILRYDSSSSKWIKDTIASLATQLEPYIVTCSCWGRINSDGTIAGSYNIASVNHSAIGVYEITFSNAMSNANYSVVATCNTSGFYAICVSNITTSGFTVEIYDNNNQATDADFSVQVFGGK